MTGTALRPPQIPGYEFRRRLAHGGHSVVLLYHQVREQRDVAVKVLTLEGAQRGASAAVVAEANKMARLSNHGNIVPVFFSAEDGDRPYLVMAYCSGQDLWSMLRQHGPFDARRVLRIGAQIADALRAAHEHGIIHRDLKPANILTDEYRTPRLTDFGISVLDDEHSDGIAVSVPWAPPEVLGGQPGGVAADLYSLGATLWNLLTGRMPFDEPGNNSPDAMEARIRCGRAARTGRVDVPAALEALLQRMLAPIPSARPASAAEVLRELERIESECGGAVRPDHPWHVQTGPVQTGLAETVHRSAPIAPPDDSALLTRTRVRRPAAGEPALATDTQRRRPVVPSPAPEPAPPTRRRPNWWLWGAAAALVVAAATAGAVLTGGQPEPPGRAATQAVEQDAGAGGELIPPGVPTITGTRLDATRARFTWTYSAPYDSDTFLWQTDGDRGTTQDPTVDVTAAGEVCLRVKVIRADGRNGSVDWSPKACVR